MTSEQIKAIAEEYAESELVMSYLRPDHNKFFAERFLNFLIRKYCIAEREKVKAFYNGDTFGELDFIEIVSTRRVLKSLFGTSMFNQNEANNYDQR